MLHGPQILVAPDDDHTMQHCRDNGSPSTTRACKYRMQERHDVDAVLRDSGC